MKRTLLALAVSLVACNAQHDAPVLAVTDAGVDAAHPAESPDLASTPDLALVEHIDPSGGGGTVGLLHFGTFGDIRPPLPDDVLQYPSTVASAIFSGMAKAQPQFVIGTGDYMFAEFSSSIAQQQLAKLADAEKSIVTPIFHAMGNHECNSLSDLNCPNLDESANIRTYLSTLIPWTNGVPWFSFIVHTSLGDAKFVFVAANAWNSAQAAWLAQVLAVSTPYTFIVRHTPSPDAGTTPTNAGVTASDAIIAGHPVTLWLFGHIHEYRHLTTNSVIAGNAGAPLVSGEYGWLDVQQRADGTIGVTAYSMATGMPMDAWAVTPGGAKSP
ncbi:MAG: metallophosphoesterase [Polyangia bacterium]